MKYTQDALTNEEYEVLYLLHINYAAGNITHISFDRSNGLGFVRSQLQCGVKLYTFSLCAYTLRYRSHSRKVSQ